MRRSSAAHPNKSRGHSRRAPIGKHRARGGPHRPWQGYLPASAPTTAVYRVYRRSPPIDNSPSLHVARADAHRSHAHLFAASNRTNASRRPRLRRPSVATVCFHGRSRDRELVCTVSPGDINIWAASATAVIGRCDVDVPTGPVFIASERWTAGSPDCWRQVGAIEGWLLGGSGRSGLCVSIENVEWLDAIHRDRVTGFLSLLPQ